MFKFWKKPGAATAEPPQNRLYIWRDKQFGWCTLRVFVDFKANLDRDNAFNKRVSDTLETAHSTKFVRMSSYPAYISVQVTPPRQEADALLDEVENYLVKQIATFLGWETPPTITRLGSDDEFHKEARRLGVGDLWRLGVTR